MSAFLSLASVILIGTFILACFGVDLSFGAYGVAGTYELDSTFSDNNESTNYLRLKFFLNNHCLLTSQRDDGSLEQSEYFWHFTTNRLYSDPSNEAFYGNYVSIFVVKIEIMENGNYATIRSFFFNREEMSLFTMPASDFYPSFIQNKFLKI